MAAADNHHTEQIEKETLVTFGNPPCACHADQELLGRQLADHADPHVRIIAHMSNRQLSMAEQIADLTKGIFRVAGGVSRTEEKLADARGDLKAVMKSVDGLTTAVVALTKAIEELSAVQVTTSARLEQVELRLSEARDP